MKSYNSSSTAIETIASLDPMHMYRKVGSPTRSLSWWASHYFPVAFGGVGFSASMMKQRSSMILARFLGEVLGGVLWYLD